MVALIKKLQKLRKLARLVKTKTKTVLLLLEQTKQQALSIIVLSNLPKVVRPENDQSLPFSTIKQLMTSQGLTGEDLYDPEKL